LSTPSASAEVRHQEDLHPRDYWYVILRRRRLVTAIFVAVASAATLKSFLTRPVYEATTQILIERENPNVLEFREVAEVKAQWGDEYYQTQYKLLQSRSLARKVIVEANLLQDPEFGGPRIPDEVNAMVSAPPGASPAMEAVVGTFLTRVRIQLVKNSRIANVAFSAYTPEAAAQIANKLAQLYIQQSLEFRYQTSAEAAQWLGGQIDDQRRKVEAAELALQGLKQREGLVNIEERRTLVEQRLRELGTALTKVKTDRLQKEALFNQMRGARNPEELPEVIKNYVIQQLRIDLAKLEGQEAQLLERYLEQHPEVVRVRNQIEESRRKISAEAQRVIRSVENDYRAAAAQEASISAAVESSKAESFDLERRGGQYDSLKREVDANKDVLKSLMARHKQTDVAQELKASNIRIVDPAVVPRAPVRPRRLLDVSAGLLFGLVLGVAAALLLEYLDSTLKTPEDVKTHLGAPLLSVIPETDAAGKARLLLDAAQHGPFVEGYRLLRTSLSYSWPERRSRVIAVSSTAPAEGKTLTSVNLALTLASSDERVLLVDGDLRKAQVHAVLHSKRSPGLSDILVGRAKPSQAIQRVAGSNLNLLAAGGHVPSPADLLTVNALKGLLDGLRSFYDWIVIDTPPIAVVSDALVIAPLTDGVVVVAGAEMIPRKAIAHTLERVAMTGARVLGVALNRTQAERRSYYYGHYQGHYYGHYHDAFQRDTVPNPASQARRRAVH
jgi:capsular exopolysaccharide synthesis family protein